LVDGGKIHVDSSLVDADAAKDSVIKGPPELIARLKRAYEATESKLAETTTPESYEAVNDRMMSGTDPDASMVRRERDTSRPRYHHHRVVDDQKGVITAVETTPGSIVENKKLLGLIEQHGANTGKQAQTVVADHKYGTQEHYVACAERGLTSHMGEIFAKRNQIRNQGIFPESAFRYDPVKDIYRCPAGQALTRQRLYRTKHTIEYRASKKVCADCLLRAQCIRESKERVLRRHEKQEDLDLALAQAHSAAARRDRKRRQHLMERSFADATNNHHFKRARWRRLWRQQIQDYLIAAIQNIRILLAHLKSKPSVVVAALALFTTLAKRLSVLMHRSSFLKQTHFALATPQT
jgi:hypothetical protein